MKQCVNKQINLSSDHLNNRLLFAELASIQWHGAISEMQIHCYNCNVCISTIMRHIKLHVVDPRSESVFYILVGLLITQVNRMFRSRRVLAIGGKHCDYGWTGSVFIHFYVL